MSGAGEGTKTLTGATHSPPEQRHIESKKTGSQEPFLVPNLSQLKEKKGSTNIKQMLREGQRLLRNKDYQRAIPWLKSASDRGSVEAAASLGYIYSNGLGLINEDSTKAKSLFTRAAKAGHIDSMYHLANLLLLDEPLTKGNVNNAREWLEKCARKGHAEAADSAAKLYEGNVDYLSALKWYKIAKKNGHPEADANIVSTQRKMSQNSSIKR